MESEDLGTHLNLVIPYFYLWISYIAYAHSYDRAMKIWDEKILVVPYFAFEFVMHLPMAVMEPWRFGITFQFSDSKLLPFNFLYCICPWLWWTCEDLGSYFSLVIPNFYLWISYIAFTCSCDGALKIWNHLLIWRFPVFTFKFLTLHLPIAIMEP